MIKFVTVSNVPAVDNTISSCLTVPMFISKSIMRIIYTHKNCFINNICHYDFTFKHAMTTHKGVATFHHTFMDLQVAIHSVHEHQTGWKLLTRSECTESLLSIVTVSWMFFFDKSINHPISTASTLLLSCWNFILPKSIIPPVSQCISLQYIPALFADALVFHICSTMISTTFSITFIIQQYWELRHHWSLCRLYHWSLCRLSIVYFSVSSSQNLLLCILYGFCSQILILKYISYFKAWIRVLLLIWCCAILQSLL